MNLNMDDIYYLRMAYQFAAENSDDCSTQNGAVIVGSRYRVVSLGANRLPCGVKKNAFRIHKATKASYIEHAERDAILRAREPLDRCMTMYCPWAACAECARAIIISGIKEVVYHQDLILKTPERWQDSVATGAEMLMEARVVLRYFSGKIGGARILFDGQHWEP